MFTETGKAIDDIIFRAAAMIGDDDEDDYYTNSLMLDNLNDISASLGQMQVNQQIQQAQRLRQIPAYHKNEPDYLQKRREWEARHGRPWDSF